MVDSQLAKSQEESGSAGSTAAPALPPVPSDAMIIVPVRGMVLFPGVVLPIAIAGRPRSS